MHVLPDSTTREPPCATAAQHGLSIPVAWRSAEELQTKLRRLGIRTTIHLNPATREASLEVWPGTDMDKARAALLACAG